MRFAKFIGVLACCLSLSACSWLSDKVEPDVPEQQLFDEALSALSGERYSEAVEKLEKLEARYPFGRYSQQAQLELIYAYHKNFEAEAANAAADRFIRLNPNHENLDYAYYLKGLTAFEQDRTFLEKFLPIDVKQRDPGSALDSFETFATLIDRFPNSQYSPDAQKRMLFLKNRLAGYEVDVARYYMRRGAYLAAANRGKYVIENLQETPAVPAALEVMYQAYVELELPNLAEDTREVLVTNYPNYPVETYSKQNESLLNTATFGLFGNSDTSETPEPPLEVNKDGASSDVDSDRSLFSRMTFGIFD